MEMNNNPQAQQLNPQWSRLAGIASVVVSLASAGGLVYLLLGRGLASDTTALAVIASLLGVMLLTAIAGVQLMRRQEWAQPVLLGFWLAVAVAAVVAGIWGMLNGTPEWWSGWTAVHPAFFHVPALVIGAAVAMMVVAASSGNSRRRYGSFVLVSVAAALAVVLAINTIAQHQDNYYRRNVEMIGQYRLSDRSNKIVSSVTEPVTVTCMYTSSDPNKMTDERRSRVMEMLAEIRDLNPKFKIVNGTGDSEKAAVLARLAAASEQKAAAHLALLRQFPPAAKKVSQNLTELRQQWEALGGSSYLDQWGVAAQVATGFKGIAEELDQAGTKVSKDLTGLVDHAKMLEEARKSAQSAREEVVAVGTVLEKLQKVSQNVAKNRDAAAKDIAASYAAVEAAAGILDGNMVNPAAVLKDFLAAMNKACEQINTTAQHVDEIGGSEYADVVRGSRAWLVDSGSTVIEGQTYATRSNISRMYSGAARALEQFKGMAETWARGGTAEFQAQSLTELRNQFPKLLKSLKQIDDAARAAIAKLAIVDAPTQQIFAQMAGGQYFESIVKPLGDLLDQAAKLPTLKASTLADDLREDNVLLVETGDKAEVVSFDDVWPLRSRPNAMAEGPAERAFNGESISSKVLSMTQPPFARVLITYLEGQPNPMGRSSDISPTMLTELRRRLEQANLKVDTWDLKNEMPADAAATQPAGSAMPTVLLVLPPPSKQMSMTRGPEGQTPGFGPEHMFKVRKAIDAGAGAIFLGHYTFPNPMGGLGEDYGWNPYLAEWGINVRNTFIVIPALRDDSGRREDGKDLYQLSLLRFWYLPLNTFTEHPVGKPLQGQRVSWYFICPVTATTPLPSVEVKPVLTVPGSWNTTWATQKFRDIARQIDNGEFISPLEGDLHSPFDVALAATRTASEGRAPSRIVAAGIASSLTDEYLTQRASLPNERGALVTTEPPKANADFVINAAYWISGREEYIAAGPAQLQPVKVIASARLLWTLCVIGLPLGVLALGGVVMILRKM